MRVIAPSLSRPLILLPSIRLWARSESAMKMPAKMSLIRKAGFGCYLGDGGFASPQTE
jgi:hypothetical protein